MDEKRKGTYCCSFSFADFIFIGRPLARPPDTPLTVSEERQLSAPELSVEPCLLPFSFLVIVTRILDAQEARKLCVAAVLREALGRRLCRDGRVWT